MAAALPVVREVKVSFYVNNVMRIDALNGIVEMDFQLYLTWIDPALKGVPVAERPSTRWDPEIEVNNGASLEVLRALYPPQYQNEEGLVVYGARYRGSLSNQMNLRDFPLDSDYFCISVGPKKLTDKELRLVIDPTKHRLEGAAKGDFPGDRIKMSSLTEWALSEPAAKISLSGPTGSGSYYANAEFGMDAHRNYMYYVYKVVIVLCFLVSSSWTAFYQEPEEDFPDRFNTMLTLFLAAVAFLFVVNDALPKTSYLTLLDKIMLLAFSLIFATGAESFAAYVIAKNGNPQIARKLDFFSRFCFPLATVLFAAGIVCPTAWKRARRIRNAKSATSSSPDNLNGTQKNKNLI